jgi:DNA-binding GntR family transcriptional regulator
VTDVPRLPSAPTRASLADAVHESLLTWLMDGHAAPGSALSIDGLARDLGVSPTPIREALARIESTGLVHRAALRGYRVAQMLSEAEVNDLMDARLLLECRNAALAVAHVDDGFLDQLTQTVRRMGAAPTGPGFAEYREYHAADNEFHHLLNRAGGNRFLLQAFEGLNGQIQRFRLRLVPGSGVTDAAEAVAEHGAVVAALRTRDAAAVEDAVRTHLERVRDRALVDRSSAISG